MTKGLLCIAVGIIVLWLFAPTYDQKYHFWELTGELLILLTGCALIFGGLVATEIGLRRK